MILNIYVYFVCIYIIFYIKYFRLFFNNVLKVLEIVVIILRNFFLLVVR